MSNIETLDYTYFGEFAERLIFDSIFIKFKYGNKYLDYFDRINKENIFDTLPMCYSEKEILKQLCEINCLKINKITKNIRLNLINNKLTITYNE
jgi:hypothetical protein